MEGHPTSACTLASYRRNVRHAFGDERGPVSYSRLKLCQYSIEMNQPSDGPFGGLSVETIYACKHKKAAGKYSRIDGFMDMSSGHDDNTQVGVAYRLPSLSICSRCSYYRRKKEEGSAPGPRNSQDPVDMAIRGLIAQKERRAKRSKTESSTMAKCDWCGARVKPENMARHTARCSQRTDVGPRRQVVKCPYCEGNLLADTLAEGDNKCPHCGDEFRVEME